MNLTKQLKQPIEHQIVLKKYLTEYKVGLAGLRASPYWCEIEKYVTDYIDEKPSVQDLWKILDAVWKDLKIDPENPDLLRTYYNHPIWLYNGVIMESDPDCLQMRLKILSKAAFYHPKKVLDLGGGAGGLLKIASFQMLQYQTLDLVDQSSLSGYIKETLKDIPIRVLESPDPPYDLVFSTEVMEHLDNPFLQLAQINHFLKLDGILIATWSFYPMLQCHLEKNFGLRRFLHRLAFLFGLRLLERSSYDGQPIYIFRKVRTIELTKSTKRANQAAFFRPLLRLVDGFFS